MKKAGDMLLKGFLLPGTLVLQKLGITIDEDGGIVRSFFNMCVWGSICLAVALSIFE